MTNHTPTQVCDGQSLFLVFGFAALGDGFDVAGHGLVDAIET